jgi:hypothetical protein
MSSDASSTWTASSHTALGTAQAVSAGAGVSRVEAVVVGSDSDLFAGIDADLQVLDDQRPEG